MSKLPKWFFKKPEHVCHPMNTLRDAAKVIKADAKAYRKEGMVREAQIADRIANRLLCVADGKTWAEAFDLPQAQEASND